MDICTVEFSSRFQLVVTIKEPRISYLLSPEKLKLYSNSPQKCKCFSPRMCYISVTNLLVNIVPGVSAPNVAHVLAVPEDTLQPHQTHGVLLV